MTFQFFVVEQKDKGTFAIAEVYFNNGNICGLSIEEDGFSSIEEITSLEGVDETVDIAITRDCYLEVTRCNGYLEIEPKDF